MNRIIVGVVLVFSIIVTLLVGIHFSDNSYSPKGSPHYTWRKEGNMYVIEQWVLSPYIGSVEVGRCNTLDFAKIYTEELNNKK